MQPLSSRNDIKLQITRPAVGTVGAADVKRPTQTCCRRPCGGSEVLSSPVLCMRTANLPVPTDTCMPCRLSSGRRKILMANTVTSPVTAAPDEALRTIVITRIAHVAEMDLRCYEDARLNLGDSGAKLDAHKLGRLVRLDKFAIWPLTCSCLEKGVRILKMILNWDTTSSRERESWN